MQGMLGVGGGLVKGPLMLEMGVQVIWNNLHLHWSQPPVQAATTAFMILFTASATLVVLEVAAFHHKAADPIPGRLGIPW